MYFPTATAQSYVTRDPLSDQHTKIIDISKNEESSLFCVLTEGTIAVWKVRVSSRFLHKNEQMTEVAQPAVLLGHITRSKISLEAHGVNQAVLWSPDSQRLVVLVSILLGRIPNFD